MDAKNRVKIGDFGLAKNFDERKEESQLSTADESSVDGLVVHGKNLIPGN
jgi:hypothetical protein